MQIHLFSGLEGTVCICKADFSKMQLENAISMSFLHELLNILDGVRLNLTDNPICLLCLMCLNMCVCVCALMHAMGKE